MTQKDHFIVPVSYYVMVLVALLILTVVTVVIAQFDFGSFNILVAMLVAVVKASLVVGSGYIGGWGFGWENLEKILASRLCFI
eukprot:SAG22_NODE_13352_length_409_cov_1.741935_1_plen_82_part_01